MGVPILIVTRALHEPASPGSHTSLAVTTVHNTSIYCVHSLLANMKTNSLGLQTYDYCLLRAVEGHIYICIYTRTTSTGSVWLLLTAVLLERTAWRWWPTRKQRKKTSYYRQAENIFLSIRKQRFFINFVCSNKGVSFCREWSTQSWIDYLHQYKCGKVWPKSYK